MSNHLLYAIAWAIATIIGICLGFYFLSATAEHLAVICIGSMAGFLTATRELISYKQSKKVTRWEK